jgi:hypothetical protein
VTTRLAHFPITLQLLKSPPSTGRLV